MKTSEKLGAILLFFVLLAGFAVAANKIEISTLKDSFGPGENVTFKVSVYDSNNNPIQGEVKVILEDANKKTQIKQTSRTNELTDIKLPDNAYYGYWKIIASYKDDSGEAEETLLFTVETNEQVRFDLTGDILTIENMGNAPYENEIQIVIGDTIGTKKVSLAIGEKISVRLTAPDGAYNVRITDGKTSLTKGEVKLTGNVIGVLDENAIQGSPPITGVSPEKESFSSFAGVFKKKNIIYLFLATIIGAAILLAIERNYRRKLGS